MQETIKEILAVFGGITAIVSATLLFCKSLIEKYINTSIENSAKKELEKIKSKMARNASAYELLLKKEFEYYERIDQLYAEIIVDIQDVCWYADASTDIDYEVRCKELKEISSRTIKKIPELKNFNLLYQVYVPYDIFHVTGNVVKTMQDGCEIIAETTKKVFTKEEIEKEKLLEYERDVLKAISLSATIIKKRLDNLSAE